MVVDCPSSSIYMPQATSPPFTHTLYPFSCKAHKPTPWEVLTLVNQVSPCAAHVDLWTIMNHLRSNLVLVPLERLRDWELTRPWDHVRSPLVFCTRPREATQIAWGHRVNYGRTGLLPGFLPSPCRAPALHHAVAPPDLAVLPLGNRSLKANV